MQRGCIYLFRWGGPDTASCPFPEQRSCWSARPGCHRPWRGMGAPAGGRGREGVQQFQQQGRQAGTGQGRHQAGTERPARPEREKGQGSPAPLSSLPPHPEGTTGKQLLLCEASQPCWAESKQLLVKISAGERFSCILGSWMTAKGITRTPHWK